jgi:hypothetical protein
MISTVMNVGACRDLWIHAPDYPCGSAALGAIVSANRAEGGAPTSSDGHHGFGMRGLNPYYFADILMMNSLGITIPPEIVGANHA